MIEQGLIELEGPMQLGKYAKNFKVIRLNRLSIVDSKNLHCV